MTVKDSCKKQAGIILVLLLCFGFYLARLVGIIIPNPAAILLLSVLFATYLSGLVAGLIAALFAWLTIAIDSSPTSQLFSQDPLILKQNIIWAIVLLLTATLIGLLKKSKQKQLQELLLMQQQSTKSQAELHRVRLSASQNKLAFILSSVDMGVWVYDLINDKLDWDAGMCRLYGVEPEEWIGTFQGWAKSLHPEDKTKVLQEFNESLKQKMPFNMRFRISLNSGQVRYIESRSKLNISEAGDVLGMFGINWDATDQALAEAELAMQRNLNDAILENIPIGVFMKDIKDNLKIALWNKASEELFEIEKSQAIGRTSQELCITGYVEQCNVSDAKVLADKKAINTSELSFLTTRKGTIYVHTIKLPLLIAPDLEPRYLLCLAEDITERKRALDEQKRFEHSIKSLNQRLALALLGAGFGVWEFDLLSNRLIWDEQMHLLYGHTPESFNGSLDAWRNCIVPSDQPLVDCRFAELMRGIPVKPFIFRCIRTIDKQLRYIEANGYMQLDNNGRPQQLVGMNRDITDSKLVEQALEKSERLFRAMFEAAPLGIALISSVSGQIEEANLRFSEITGRSIDEIKRMKWTDFAVPGDNDSDDEQINLFINNRVHSHKLVKRYLRPDGTMVWVDMAIAPISHQDSTPARHLCMIEDISERIRVEAELKKAKEIAEDSTQVKSAFLANMSHEIRTPLTVIRGFTELLLSNQVNPDLVKTWSSNILRSSQQLELLLGDILDLSKVESGKITLEFVEFSLQKIMTDIRSMLLIFAEEKGIKLNFIAEGKIPATIYSDPGRFKQILINVISNAIKFTERGSVSVITSLGFQSEDPNKKTLNFEIKDTGIGIRTDQREKVFEIFTQADNSITRRFGGTGLGLPLARHLARLLGGNIILSQSQLNIGTSFIVTIDPGPIEAVDMVTNLVALNIPALPAQTEVGKSINLKKIRILLVEDAVDLQALIRLVLENHNAWVDSACNGLEAIELVNKNVYDIILMDIQMPVLGGYEATRLLRQKNIKIPIIALTAHAMKGERERCLDAGFSEHLAKPVDFKKMLQLIDRYTAHEFDAKAYIQAEVLQ